MAALFQVLEHGLYGSIELSCFEAASRIVAWHLNESRRFYGELALPKELADAVRLDKWLIGHCKQKNILSLNKNHIRQYGPLRDGMRLNSALKELTDLDRLSITEHGKGHLISINPKLIKDKL